MPYDPNNIFARLLRNEIACQKVFEDEQILAFKDVHPRAPTHILVIPKGQYTDYHDFCLNASPEKVSHFFTQVATLCKELGDDGYRLISNCGVNGGQEVQHFHVHICAGQKLGKMV